MEERDFRRANGIDGIVEKGLRFYSRLGRWPREEDIDKKLFLCGTREMDYL